MRKSLNLEAIKKLPKDKIIDLYANSKRDYLNLLKRYMRLAIKFKELTGEKVNYSDPMEPFNGLNLMDVKAAQKALAGGRKIRNEKWSSDREVLKSQLEKAVIDYMDKPINIDKRKVPNKEIADYLAKQGFVGEKRYTEKTLFRTVSFIAAAIRKIVRESSGQ